MKKIVSMILVIVMIASLALGLTACGEGKDGVTPQLRINPDTNFWEVSYDEGATWVSMEVKATGEDGKDGTDGKDGVDGKDGIDGKDGVNGKDGINGTNGKDGADGKDGKDGANGNNGTNGTNGSNGVTPTIGEDGYAHAGDFENDLLTEVQEARDSCPVSAISEGDGKYVIDPDTCISCGSCAGVCPVGAPAEA